MGRAVRAGLCGPAADGPRQPQLCWPRSVLASVAAGESRASSALITAALYGCWLLEAPSLDRLLCQVFEEFGRDQVMVLTLEELGGGRLAGDRISPLLCGTCQHKRGAGMVALNCPGCFRCWPGCRLSQMMASARRPPRV